MSNIELSDREPEVQLRTVCPACKGTRYFLHDDDIQGIVPHPCTHCDGAGKVMIWVRLDVLMEIHNHGASL